MKTVIGKNPARHSRRLFAGAALAMLCAISPVAGATNGLDEGDVKEPYSAPKAMTLKGAAYDGASVAGIVELKLGKVDKKKTSKVSGSVTSLDGKKHAIKPFPVIDVDGSSPKTASLEVKGLGTMSVTIGGERFAGSLGSLHVQSADVGGNWTQAGSVVNVKVPTADLSKFAGAVVKGLLPADEPVTPAGGKWKFAKAATVKWAKLKSGVATFGGLSDAASGKGLLVDTSKGANLSGMKLVYTPKKGTFKGAFKLYALEGSGAKTKLKKYTVKVSGVVVGGEGHGEAVCNKPKASWAVSVRAKGSDSGQSASGPGQPEREKVQLWEGGPYWATTNIGAEKPEDYGLYFWWGDTKGDRPSGTTFSFSFEASNCPTYVKSTSELQSEGWITGGGVLAPEHDAAHVLWGGKWRIPTQQELQNLVDKCDWSPATVNGVDGFEVRGRGGYASASIFLPCSGYGYGTSLTYAGSYGCYWSSVPYSDDNYAWDLYFCSGCHGTYNDYGGRYYGRSVRPVQGFTE